MVQLPLRVVADKQFRVVVDAPIDTRPDLPHIVGVGGRVEIVVAVVLRRVRVGQRIEI